MNWETEGAMRDFAGRQAEWALSSRQPTRAASFFQSHPLDALLEKPYLESFLTYSPCTNK